MTGQQWTSLGKRLVCPGRAFPFGATVTEEGVQFSLFSRHATAVSLLLFNSSEDEHPVYELPLNPKLYRSGDCWHILVKDIGEGQLYLYKVDGPYEPEEGHRFNRNCLLIDPYAKALTGTKPWSLQSAFGYDSAQGDLCLAKKVNTKGMPKCVVVSDIFDWQGDRPLNYPLQESIIYETHVKGLSSHPDTIKRFAIKKPGTFAGIVEMIPYIKDLGITSLELLPVFEFDEHEYANQSLPETDAVKTNYWGYSTMAFFAPKSNYAAESHGPSQVNEFKTMVRELHKAGIEVILDVVFNHTGEGDQRGPTLSFRGLDNSIYYMLDDNKRYYRNYSGCGNTMNCNHPVVRSLIIDCLRYWVQEMHVDGFRFDLASILGRGSQGEVLDNPPVLERIDQDPVLRDTKIIAEAWDAGGAYQVGSFPGGRWAEWNDHFRDDVRSFWRGNSGMKNALASRICGSSDIYSPTKRKPYHSINYITAHDGFTLFDLTAYNRKHNEANGEQNRDGSDNSISCNWGVEGESNDDKVNEIRARMQRNFWAVLMLSSGTPMILGGDEFLRTQQGNNNAYCQDNEISWYDFKRMDRFSNFFHFARQLIALRKNHPALRRREFYSGTDHDGNQISDILWFNKDGHPIDWESQDNILGLRIDGNHKEIQASEDYSDIIMLFNSSPKEIEFTLPDPKGKQHWHRVVDTSSKYPDAVKTPGSEVPLEQKNTCSVSYRSMVLLISI